MAIGFMEVQLLKAKGLSNTDIFGSMDPYVLIQYNGQEQRSSVAIDQGRNPIWNEKFIFKVQNSALSNRHKLILKIMDKDLHRDDFVGQATIHVGDLLVQGVENGVATLKTLKYRVVHANQSYCGEIDVGVTFTRKVEEEFVDGDIGGWKESQGINPVWNEKFIFKTMDQDLYTDEFVGESIIHVGDLLALRVDNGEAKLQTVKYRVVGANKSYCGQIEVGVYFHPTGGRSL